MSDTKNSVEKKQKRPSALELATDDMNAAKDKVIKLIAHQVQACCDNAWHDTAEAKDEILRAFGTYIHCDRCRIFDSNRGDGLLFELHFGYSPTNRDEGAFIFRGQSGNGYSGLHFRDFYNLLEIPSFEMSFGTYQHLVSYTQMLLMEFLTKFHKELTKHGIAVVPLEALRECVFHNE